MAVTVTNFKNVPREKQKSASLIMGYRGKLSILKTPKRRKKTNEIKQQEKVVNAGRDFDVNIKGSSRNRVGKKQHKIGLDWLWITRNRVFIGIRNLA